MRIIQDRTEFHIDEKSAVALGKFDGIHKGHEVLLSHILEQKKNGLLAVVFTFHPSAAVYFGKGETGELTTRMEKRRFFEELGIDVLVEFPLNSVTAAIAPEDFITGVLKKNMNAAYIVAGGDVSFGYRGLGRRELLERMSEEFDYRVEIIDKVYHKDREISSTYVREEVECGHMEEAAQLLGRNYSITGCVESGNRLGRRLGMPTLNLYPEEEKLLPPKGVYYSRVLYDGCSYPGITNIGKKPTVNDTEKVSVETFLYDFDKDMYGKEIITELLYCKRPEQKFADVQALKEQMEKDIAEGTAYHCSRKEISRK